MFELSVFVVVSAVVGGFDGLRWLVASVEWSDCISVVAVDRGRVEFDLRWTSGVIVKTHKESRHRSISVGVSDIYSGVRLGCRW